MAKYIQDPNAWSPGRQIMKSAGQLGAAAAGSAGRESQRKRQDEMIRKFVQNPIIKGSLPPGVAKAVMDSDRPSEVIGLYLSQADKIMQGQLKQNLGTFTSRLAEMRKAGEAIDPVSIFTAAQEAGVLDDKQGATLIGALSGRQLQAGELGSLRDKLDAAAQQRAAEGTAIAAGGRAALVAMGADEGALSEYDALPSNMAKKAFLSKFRMQTEKKEPRSTPQIRKEISDVQREIAQYDVELSKQIAVGPGQQPVPATKKQQRYMEYLEGILQDLQKELTEKAGAPREQGPVEGTQGSRVGRLLEGLR